MLVADNALSHPDEIAALHDLLRGALVAGDLTAVTTIPVSKGEIVARSRPGPTR